MRKNRIEEATNKKIKMRIRREEMMIFLD